MYALLSNVIVLLASLSVLSVNALPIASSPPTGSHDNTIIRPADLGTIPVPREALSEMPIPVQDMPPHIHPDVAGTIWDVSPAATQSDFDTRIMASKPIKPLPKDAFNVSPVPVPKIHDTVLEPTTKIKTLPKDFTSPPTLPSAHDSVNAYHLERPKTSLSGNALKSLPLPLHVSHPHSLALGVNLETPPKKIHISSPKTTEHDEQVSHTKSFNALTISDDQLSALLGSNDPAELHRYAEHTA